MTGQVISHYKILEQLGEGGMGVIFKAEDIDLQRTVALKFLPSHRTDDSEARERFIHEAQAASALDHPNICTIFEIGKAAEGRMFIAMAYYRGTTVKERIAAGPIPFNETINIVLQIASGLGKAHEAGIVHRDIKPANIIITDDGVAKILDFGLAKLKGLTQVTRAGSTLGTAAYMSPEQARGEEVDRRSDIFSLGVVLYEMLTGRLPFRGEHEAALIYSIMNEEPVPLSRDNETGTPAIEQIVMKALAKDPDERYQHTDDLMADLRSERRKHDSAHTRSVQIPGATSVTRGAAHRLRPGVLLAVVIGVAVILYFLLRPARTIDSIAVLPFVDVNADSTAEYISDGITENLINSLATIPGLRVIPRSTAFHYKGRDVDLREVGKALKIHSLLTGRIIHRGGELNIQMDLVDVTTESQVWGAQYHRNLSDLANLQREIIREVSRRLQPGMNSEEIANLSRGQTASADALQLYLKGRYYWNKRSESGLRNAIIHFQQAIEKDPGYALAYTGLADSYTVLAAFGIVAPHEAFPKAEAAITKALEFDTALAEAHTTLAFILQHYDWKWAEAENEYLKAIRINPSYATAFHWYGLLLSTVRRDSEAVVASEHAAELDPLSLPIAASLGYTYVEVGQYEKARAVCSKAIEMDSGFAMAHAPLALADIKLGRIAEGLHELEINAGRPASTPEDLAWLGYAYARAAQPGDARKILAGLQARQQNGYVPPLFFALLHLGLGEKEEAFQWLEQAYEAHDFYLGSLPRPIQTDLVGGGPRFRDVFRRMGLEIPVSGGVE